MILFANIKTIILLATLEGVIGYFRNEVVYVNISKWPAATVPYKLSTDFTRQEVKVINSILRKFTKTTCLKFIPRTVEVDFVHFRRTRAHGECGAILGRVGGEQLISLAATSPNTRMDKKCISRANIAKYVMRTLGFFPENLREDRDHYISINWGNVKHWKVYDLRKIRGAIFDLKMPYDYYSVLHQRENIYAKDDSKRTISINPDFGVVFGRPQGLSYGDIAKVQSVYCLPDVIIEPDPPLPFFPCEWNNC